jgi:hypothetical protein
MTSIAKQNTIEALNIYHKAQKKEWGVRVVDGNVRVATWTEHLGSRIKNYFNPSRERTNWNEKAKNAILDKLCGEVLLLQEKIDSQYAKSLLKNIFLPEIKQPEVDFLYMLGNSNLLKDKENIKELWKIKDKKQYGLIVEELNHAKDQDLIRAKKVANYTLELIKKFGLSKDIALNTARKIKTAMDEFNLDYDKAFELVEATGNLINTGVLNKDLPLKLSLSAAQEFIQLLDKGTNRNEAKARVIAIYEFKIQSNEASELFKITEDLISKGHLDKKLPLKLQLSASLAFIQLAEKKIDLDTAITTVKNRIDVLKKIQNRIPKDMQIDCVHEGKDYEYKVSFSKEQKEKLAASLKTQISKNNLYVKGKYIAMEKDIKDTSYISCIENFDYQALKDGQRSKSLYKYNGEIIKALNKNPQSNQDSNIRDIPESLLEKEFLNPLKNFQIKTKLNDKNITDISHFTSQTTLGTLLNFEIAELKSHVQGASSNQREKLFYDANFIEDETKEGSSQIFLKVTQYCDGDNLIIQNFDSEQISSTTLPITEFFKYEKDGKAGPEKFRQKMNVELEIQINQNDEIQITVIDAGSINKFSIDYETLDAKPIDEIF